MSLTRAVIEVAVRVYRCADAEYCQELHDVMAPGQALASMDFDNDEPDVVDVFTLFGLSSSADA